VVYTTRLRCEIILAYSLDGDLKMFDDGWTDEDYEADYDYSDWEEPSDYLLAQQELEDFAQDGYFENMDASEIL
jgi:hypothetical protein